MLVVWRDSSKIGIFAGGRRLPFGSRPGPPQVVGASREAASGAEAQRRLSLHFERRSRFAAIAYHSEAFGPPRPGRRGRTEVRPLGARAAHAKVSLLNPRVQSNHALTPNGPCAEQDPDCRSAIHAGLEPLPPGAALPYCCMISAFPLSPLGSPLFDTERASLQRTLRQLLHWQRKLEDWPVPGHAPDATPIVSLYAQGALRGCAGVSEGPPAERLLRAFVQALGESRFGALSPEARAELRCQLSFARAMRALPLSQVMQILEVGTHGVAVALPGRSVSLLPDVARDSSLDAEGMLRTLEHKSETKRAAWPTDGLYLFETESVLVRPDETPDLERNPATAAASWLAARVDAEGRVTFGVNPRGAEQQTSPMFHGHAAILVRALFSQRVGRGAATRARRWLEAELSRALAGRPVDQFPTEPAPIAGTLALAALAGIELGEALHAYAARPELRAVPWHAAQVVTALGMRAPDALWQACKRSLQVEPWAPWTALAAKARGDSETLARTASALIAAVPETGPHSGGVGRNSVPELARTAITVEALLAVDSAAARAACARARAFLLEHQVNGERYALTADPGLVHGAFPQTPVHDYLQVDVTAHALLALAADNRPSSRPAGT